jgi:predicted dehydrogenase
MKIGIFGNGKIVHSALQAIKESDQLSAQAICCRPASKEKTMEIQKQYGIPSLYTDADEFLASNEFDTVYIGLINSVHYDYAKKALEAGKNVICEKPFTTNGAQCAELIKLAKEKKLFLFEAIMSRYTDNYESIRNHLDKLGKITLIQTNYSQYSSRYDDYLQGKILPAFDPKLAGGSLYDINLYCIQFIMGLFGKPKSQLYMANIGPNGIDTSGILCMDYGSFKAVAAGAKDSDSPAKCVIQGEKGCIVLNNLPGLVEHVDLCLKKQEPVCIDVKPLGNPMTNEFVKMNEVIENKDYQTCYHWLDQSQDVMDVLEQARKQAGIYFCDEKENA